MVEPRRILDCFPTRATPRPGQASTLEALERDWDKGDVFVIVMPVGSGKSLVAETIARWAASMQKRSTLVVPSNVLLEQYVAAAPKLASLRAKKDYTCHEGTTSHYHVSCDENSKKKKGKARGQQGGYCKGCPYVAANRKVRAVPYSVVNSWTYMAHKLYNPVVVFDEAHNLLGMVREFAAKKVWQKEVPYPYNLKTYKDLLNWVLKARSLYPQLEEMARDLQRPNSYYLIEKGEDLYRGKLEPCLKMLPIDTRNAPPLLWPKGPRGVEKVVLLSATISPQDIEQMGLSRRRVVWIESPSPIPAKQRPLVFLSPGVRMGFDSSDVDLKRAASLIDQVALRHKDEKGVLHVTYPLMETLLPLLSEETRKRVLWHTKESREEVYKAYLAAPNGAILMGAGLQEGIDLVGDLGRWQVVVKVPWPSLTEPAWKWVMEQDPQRYNWETLRLILQASGRVCRGPTDWGVTYVLDRSFQRLDLTLAPSWFRESLQAGLDSDVFIK